MRRYEDNRVFHGKIRNRIERLTPRRLKNGAGEASLAYF